MAFRSSQVAVTPGTAAQAAVAVRGDLDVWISGDAEMYVGGDATVSATTGLVVPANTVLRSRVHPGDEIWCDLGTGGTSVSVLIKSV